VLVCRYGVSQVCDLLVMFCGEQLRQRRLARIAQPPATPEGDQQPGIISDGSGPTPTPSSPFIASTPPKPPTPTAVPPPKPPSPIVAPTPPTPKTDITPMAVDPSPSPVPKPRPSQSILIHRCIEKILQVTNEEKVCGWVLGYDDGSCYDDLVRPCHDPIAVRAGITE